MTMQQDTEKKVSRDRFAPYLQAAAGDPVKGLELYRWNNELSGALHSQLSNIEILTRNSIDRALKAYNLTMMGTENWTESGKAAPYIFSILKSPLETARKYARSASRRRRNGHARKGVPITHSDCVSQFTFGNWCALLGEDPASYRHAAMPLWKDGLNLAFPGIDQGDSGREVIGKRLLRIHQLRNRVAHHENLLEVKVGRRFNDMIALVAAIDSAYPQWAVSGSRVRKVAKQDPRQNWHARTVAW
ncbi:hypothetical protein [Corynebacterium variabile]|uniref:hypothetical protein n=1 Tax=Corynebacterium variabile TaxID=1727 RepID=UPI003F9D3CBB